MDLLKSAIIVSFYPGCVGAHGRDSTATLLPGPADGQQAASDAGGRGRLWEDGTGKRQAVEPA